MVGAELPTKLLLDREGWRWEQILPVGEGDVYCCGVHRGIWVSPLSPIMWCVQGARPFTLAQMLQLGPLWGSTRRCLVSPLTLLAPEWCWAPWALLCAMLQRAPAHPASQP